VLRDSARVVFVSSITYHVYYNFRFWSVNRSAKIYFLTVTKACTGEPQTITVNGTRLVQPVSGIGTTVDSCRYSIPKQAGVCQIRLDFTNFMIDEGPEAEFFGNCVADTLDISGQTNGKLGHLCGNLAGQHSKGAS